MVTRVDRPVGNPIVVLREETDEWALLYNPDTAQVMAVNPVGVAVWRLMDGRRRIEDIAVEVRDRYSEVPASVEDDVRSFIEELAGLGFVGTDADEGER